jgi:hypothetical protein
MIENNNNNTNNGSNTNNQPAYVIVETAPVQHLLFELKGERGV